MGNGSAKYIVAIAANAAQPIRMCNEIPHGVCVQLASSWGYRFGMMDHIRIHSFRIRVNRDFDDYVGFIS